MSKQPKKAPAREKTVTLLVPMLAENWALSLATGFIGGRPRHDVATDAQSLFEGGIVGAKGKVPGWMLQHGETGARVLLEVSVPAAAVEEEGGFLIVRGLQRVTQVKSCRFPSEDAKKDFSATYGAFPDVPANLVPAVVKKMPVAGAPGLDLPVPVVAAEGLEEERQAVDLACGWIAGLVSLFGDPSLDALYGGPVQAGPNGNQALAGIAGQALLALAPEASDVDLAIWRAVVATLLAPAAQRANGRHGVLDAVEERLQGEGALGTDAAAWLSKSSDVVSAKCDLPPLSDDGSIGRRAALAAVIGDASGALPLGNRVAALVSLVSLASTGFTRSGIGGIKGDHGTLDGLLSLGQGLANGTVPEFNVIVGSLDADFCAAESLVADGKIIANRKRAAPLWAGPLQDAASRQGLLLAPDPDSGLLGAAEQATGEQVLFEEVTGPEGPELRAWVTLAIAKGKSPGLKALGGLLDEAWKSGTQVGIRKDVGGDRVCAFISAPLGPFDAGLLIGTAQQLCAKAGLLREALS